MAAGLHLEYLVNAAGAEKKTGEAIGVFCDTNTS